ncbi:MAG TPA: hypothetical protein VFU58_07675 [Candidatus Nitrosotalea sp.]|nr:hypothetical protein [Candidatus Nitrosotalea sp.]
MSEDLASVIEEMIKSGKGDAARLQNILTAIKNSEPVSFEDHQYIENLTQTQPNQVSSDTTQDVTENVSDIPSPTSPEISEPTKKSLSKKYASIGVIVAIIIVAYVGLDVYAVNNLQFRPHHGQQVAISDTELTIQTDACNPSYFPATFTTYEIDAYYNSDIIEKATVGGSTLSPKSAATLDGIFAINKQAVNKIGQTNATFDPTKATITTTVSAPIFGFIPYSIDKKYDALDFQNRIKNPPPGTFDCFP